MIDKFPSNETVDQWLYKSHGVDTSYDKYENHFAEIELDIDVNQLAKDCVEAFDHFGWIGFANIFSPVMQRSTSYGGLSLVYNPDYQFSLEDVHMHTLGYPRLTLPQEFYNEKDIWLGMISKKVDKDFYSILNQEGYLQSLLFLFDNNVIDSNQIKNLSKLSFNQDKIPLKNTYNDTYSFNHLTPAAGYKSIGDITSKFKRSIVRSRLASLNTYKGEKETGNQLKEYLWHRDCSWFKELRFNISVTTEKDNHTIQLIDDTGPVYPYKAGHAYVWDTDIPHVQHSKKTTDFDRINLIYAVSPWFDYDADNNAWYPNEFCQKKHPLDMLLDGDVIDMDFKNVHISKATTH